MISVRSQLKAAQIEELRVYALYVSIGPLIS